MTTGTETHLESKDNFIKRVMRRIDRFQQSKRFLAFVFAVVKKFGDDQGGSLAALLTYYGFLSVFPLLLVLITVLGLVVGSHPALEKHILHSAFSQFPVFGTNLESNISALKKSSPVALIIGLVGLLWGSTGVSQSAQYAMAQVWNIPKIQRPGFLPRLGRSGLLIAVGGVFLIVSSGLAGLATASGHQAVIFRIGGALLSAIADVALFVLIFRVLTPSSVEWRDLIPGSIFGGVLWALLQTLGVFLVDHELRNASQIYGFFAIVLGILWWIYLAAQVVIYSAELNVVRSRKLWPRSLVQPPLTEADRMVLRLYALEEQRRPEVTVSATQTPETDAAEPESED